jgi:hypothetical protein
MMPYFHGEAPVEDQNMDEELLSENGFGLPRQLLDSFNIYFLILLFFVFAYL